VFKRYSCCTFDPTNKNTEIMTTILRTSETKFTKTITRQDGKALKIEIYKGSPEYTNACNDFRKANVEIILGNLINA
jgi:hypothetical protein